LPGPVFATSLSSLGIPATAELEAAIQHYINITNGQVKPFVWTKSANDILATVKRFCLATLKTAQTQAMICKTSESGH